MKRRVIGLMAASLVLLPAAGWAEPLSDAELGQVRAGYINAQGMQFSLTATMQSYLDGTAVLRSTMTMNDSGISTTQQADASALPLSAASSAGLNLGAETASNGAVVKDASGGVAFIHNLSSEQFANVVVSNASGHDIAQNTDITLYVPNLDTVQQNASFAGLATRLQDTLNQGLLDAAGK
jgi:hypothetical protein